MNHTINRRKFIRDSAATCLTLSIPFSAQSGVRKTTGLSLGLIADLHHDIMHDGYNRLQAFVKEMKKEKPDAIMQLGDFAYPNLKNKNVIDLFNNAHSTVLHVIGNHDTDSGHTYQQCRDIWGIPANYYAKKINGFWVIVLNGNDKGSPLYKGGYPSYIGEEQLNWLKNTLTEADGPAIVVCHQPLAGVSAVDNAGEVQKLISAAKDRVVLVLNGHTHIDSLLYVEDIPYLTINSASYFWVGEKYRHDSYTKEIHESHKWISSTCPYRDALYTVLTINSKKQRIELKGKKSMWVGKSPEALGYALRPELEEQKIVPEIIQKTVPLPQDAIIPF